MEAAHEKRLPKLAPTGRAGVRAMKGPVRRSERREAPIQCGFARTYEADAEATTPFGTTTPLPAGSVSASYTERSNRTFVQTRQPKWSRETGRRASPASVDGRGDRGRPGRRDGVAAALVRGPQTARCTASKAAPRRMSCSETSVKSRLK